jgi:hypothetical protein
MPNELIFKNSKFGNRRFYLEAKIMLERKFVRSLVCLVVVLSFSATATMGANILFIVNDPTLVSYPNDALLKNFFEVLGHTVTYFDDQESEAAMEAAAAAADLVWISESVGSSNVANKITEIEVPMVVGEPYCWDEMGMTLNSPCITSEVATTDITIVNPGHYLGAGLSGTVSVLTDIVGSAGMAEFANGIAGGEGIVIATATLADGQTWDVILVYEKGARLAVAPADGSPQVAADIRIGMFFHYNAHDVLNENTYALIEAAINYALGLMGPPALAGSPRPGDGAKSVPKEVALTWRPGAYVEGLSPKHRVFFSENFDDVNGGIGGIEQDVARYPIDGTLSLDMGKTYYWRVDEANSTIGWDVGAPWQFTVTDHLVVDGFESYKNSPVEAQLYNTWIDGYGVETNGSMVGHDADITQGEYIVETKIIHGGRQSMPYTFDNRGPANYSEAERTFSPAQDWTREDVDSLSLWFRGYPAYVGSFVEAPAGTYTMTASGTDIWSMADEFHFAYKELSGAGVIIAKVESVENMDPWAKAGVMIRDTLEPDSANVALLVTPENGVRFQYRNTAGNITDRDFVEGITAPQWVKLERTTGGLVRALYSADGSAWTQMGMRAISMKMPVYIGLALTSHEATLTCEAKFSNVSFPDTSVGPGWTDQDIGITSNAAEPMYVTVADGSGTAVTVYHDDPDAALIDTWTEWVIPLTNLSNAGVVLTDVSKLSIGFGDKSNPQPGGSGLMYFDDIRLYLPR